MVKVLYPTKKFKSFSLIPEDGIYFEKREFYSDLKQKSVNDEDYESLMYMNDLYNRQDVILFCEIIENRF